MYIHQRRVSLHTNPIDEEIQDILLLQNEQANKGEKASVAVRQGC